MPESFSLTAVVTFAQDENLSNNSMTETFYSGYPPLSMLVNEVMYSPSAGGSEWIEFVNNTSESINLNQWKVAERSKLGNPVGITDNDIIIEPNEYFVVAADTSTGEFRDLDIKLFEANFGTLNSTEDDVVIFDFRNAIIDSLNYSSSWGGGGGVSIERISLSAPTNERTNWLPSMSISGASLGSANSTSGIIQAGKNQVVVNEIMYEPETDNSEFVEFYNTSDQFIEIANWTVEDDSKNSSIISSTSMSIPPESYFVVAADSSILLNYPELKDFERLIIVNRNMSLNNSEDLVYLTNAFSATVDSVFYNSSWHNKRTTSTRNKSLERINPFLDGNDPNNWSTSVSPEGSTPGKANSIFIENQESGNAISLTPNPFSPDGDGFEDFAIINYKLPREAVSIHIQVFDSKGRKVRSISEENLFTDKGSIIFDGFNDRGQPLKIGIYILLIEAFDSGGSTHTFKEVVVVARKL
ncbi:MAG: lamin tail domain-containing protein [Melioribacteraceae bacterium]|nr:lamin tail domain-containing protein [Melioribacteraceae bacterium]